MKRIIMIAGCSAVAGFGVLYLGAVTAQSKGMLGTVCVILQPVLTATAQKGHIVINGKALAGALSASGGAAHPVAVTGQNGADLVGVQGSASGSKGIGVVGICGGGGTAVFANGNFSVAGNLVVTGSKVGYLADVVLNGGGEDLLPGDVVEIMGSEPPVLGEIPVMVVRKASTPMSLSVLGPIDAAVELRQPTAIEGEAMNPNLAARYTLADQLGAVGPGEYGRVVTRGAFRAIKVDASFGPIRAGDLLVSSERPGYAMASDDPRIGSVIGTALSGLGKGSGVIPVLVQPR